MANRTREEPRSVGRPRRNPKRVGLCCKSIDFRGAFIRGARHLLEMRADMASVSTEEKVAIEEKYGLAPGILGRDAPVGKDTTKAPSINEMNNIHPIIISTTPATAAWVVHIAPMPRATGVYW